MRFGWPDLLAIGYLVATVLSLLYTGYDIGLSSTHIYDRIFVPVVLYLVVRLLEPDHDDIRRLIPILGFVLAAQAAIGGLSWVAPGILPGAWLNHTGERTVGSLNETNLFGITVLSCGLLLGHAALAGSWGRLQRWALLAASALGLGLAVFTFSRAIWLALIVTMFGLSLIYPRYTRNLVLVGVAVLSLVLYSGALDSQIELAQNRFRSEQSEESALSRVPVIIASLNMYQDRPVFGFGYENFDRFDLRYQEGVHNLYLPEEGPRLAQRVPHDHGRAGHDRDRPVPRPLRHLAQADLGGAAPAAPGRPGQRPPGLVAVAPAARAGRGLQLLPPPDPVRLRRLLPDAGHDRLRRGAVRAVQPGVGPRAEAGRRMDPIPVLALALVPTVRPLR